jgi:D-xylose transport system substrate-binding protein
MRRMLGFVAAALLALGAAACGGDDEAAKPSGGGGEQKELSGKIAVLLPDTKSSDRWEKADRRFFGEAFKAAGLSDDDFMISNAQGDPATQRSQAEQAITEGAR